MPQKRQAILLIYHIIACASGQLFDQIYDTGSNNSKCSWETFVNIIWTSANCTDRWESTTCLCRRWKLKLSQKVYWWLNIFSYYSFVDREINWDMTMSWLLCGPGWCIVLGHLLYCNLLSTSTDASFSQYNKYKSVSVSTKLLLTFQLKVCPLQTDCPIFIHRYLFPKYHI